MRIRSNSALRTWIFWWTACRPLLASSQPGGPTARNPRISRGTGCQPATGPDRSSRGRRSTSRGARWHPARLAVAHQHRRQEPSRRTRSASRPTSPFELVATGEASRTSLLHEWLSAGTVILDGERLTTPTLRGRPGVYRFTVADGSGARQYVIGETENLALLMNAYRHPDATQPAHARRVELLSKTLSHGGSVTVESWSPRCKTARRSISPTVPHGCSSPPR